MMYQTDHHGRNDDRQHVDNENGGGQTGRTDALLSVSSQRTTCDYLLTRPSSDDHRCHHQHHKHHNNQHHYL